MQQFNILVLKIKFIKMRLLTITFYISLIFIIAKCNSNESSESATENKSDNQIESKKMIYSIEELTSEKNEILFTDSTKQNVIIVSSSESNHPKTLDFLLGNQQPRPFLK